jgi:hypothetical protein
MVISSGEPWSPADLAMRARAGRAFATCTAESLASDNDDFAHARLILYRGATIDEPVNGMHSFVPALPVEDEYPRFTRPPLRLPGLITQPAHRAPSEPAGPGSRMWSATRGKPSATRFSVPALY